MRSSKEQCALGFAAFVLTAATHPSRAEAQQQAQKFAVERFYPSAPGAGWFVMDRLDMHGGLGGAIALTAGHALNPLRVTDGPRRLVVISDKAFADFGFAITYERWRLYLNLDMPLATGGQNGAAGGYQFTPVPVDPGSHPDVLADARIGADARLLGKETSPFRLGAGAQLIVPNGNRALPSPDVGASYETDGTYRAMGRMLFAGDVGLFTYAGQIGVHVRPLDDAPTPESPRGSELLFGVAGGARLPVFVGRPAALVVGPEIYGATAFRSFFGSTSTALEGLLTARIEGTAEGPQLRLKLGTGPGIHQHFGAAEWRALFSIELFDHSTGRPADMTRHSTGAVTVPR